ncbi:MAG: hypothetical protein ACXWE3_08410, partial [Methylobacter sp.]
MLISLIPFFLFLVAVIYIVGLALTDNSTQIKAKEVYMYSGTLALIGCISEVAVNSFCRAVFDAPLWIYRITAVHQGDTSMFAFFQWSLYGYHLYFVQKKIQS